MEEKKNEAMQEAAAVQEEAYKSGSVQYIDSREVAEIVGKAHNELLKDIRRYVKQFGQVNIPQSDFFTESTYKNSQNKTMPCYLVTKKGCEFIAHKLTGIKGTKFTATYINRFHEMEERIRTAPLEITGEMIERIIEKMAGRVARTGQMGCSGNGNIGPFQEGGLYGGIDREAVEIRKKELYAVTGRIADSFGESHSWIPHQMYKALEEKLGIVLDAYKSVYQSETGKRKASMVEAIAANDWIYEMAMSMNEYVIRGRQVYG